MTTGTETPDLSGLRGSIGADVAQLSRELDEIGMLAQQAKVETERHEGRRVKGEERVAQLERDPQTAPAEIREARLQLLTLTRRASLFESQQQVLEGKQRALTRFRDRLTEIDAELGGMGVVAGAAKASSPGAGTPAIAAVSGMTSSEAADRTAVVRAQEEMRRDIARQMHDGPAQSLANIALQSEIVQRLASRGDARTPGELEALRRMVNHALEATKEFIFAVRPMVLDDLGLVPTLRRMATDRGRRAGVEIDLDSQGQDRRLTQDLESGLFRLIDDFVAACLTLGPSHLAVRLDWSEKELAATIRAAWLRDPSGARPAAAITAPAELREDMPPALRAMIEENRTEKQQVKVVTHELPAELQAQLQERAQDIGITLAFHDEGTTLEMNVPLGA